MDVGDAAAREKPVSGICLEALRELAHRGRRIVLGIERDRQQSRGEMRALDSARRVRELRVDQRARVGAVRRNERHDEWFSAQRRKREGVPALIDQMCAPRRAAEIRGAGTTAYPPGPGDAVGPGVAPATTWITSRMLNSM